jgi:hypothetical protein
MQPRSHETDSTLKALLPCCGIDSHALGGRRAAWRIRRGRGAVEPDRRSRRALLRSRAERHAWRRFACSRWRPISRRRDASASFVYELRVAWDPPPSPDVPPEPIVTRVIRRSMAGLRVPITSQDATDPRQSRRSRWRCFRPAAASSKPFVVGTGRTDRRATVMLDYRTPLAAPPGLKVKGECISVSSGDTQGRIWLMRQAPIRRSLGCSPWSGRRVPVPREMMLKSGVGWIDFERADSSIRYRPVTFTIPTRP